ncbi:MAG: hypothetical protein GXP27_19765 [Planctomycetes bacterium]|nr:hypothetical protein [Planctomycetota bacterium]
MANAAVPARPCWLEALCRPVSVCGIRKNPDLARTRQAIADLLKSSDEDTYGALLATALSQLESLGDQPGDC